MLSSFSSLVQLGFRLSLGPFSLALALRPWDGGGRRRRRGGRHEPEGPAEFFGSEHLTIRERLPESHQRAPEDHQGLFPHPARLQAERELAPPHGPARDYCSP